METFIAYAVALPILGLIIRSAFDLLEDILNMMEENMSVNDFFVIVVTAGLLIGGARMIYRVLKK